MKIVTITTALIFVGAISIAQAQGHGGGGHGGGHSGSGAHSGGGGHAGGGGHSGGGHAASTGGHSSASTAHASSSGGRVSGRTNAAGKVADPSQTGVPPYSRPSNGQDVVGTAVPRGSVPSAPGSTVFVSPIYAPFRYYGGFGFGGYSLGAYGLGVYSLGYYDPYGSIDPWYGAYGGAYPSDSWTPSSSRDEGALRLKIRPKQGQVYVDGEYVGIVDDFDGLFQKLHLAPGPHRVEIRATGYETLDFDVRVAPDHTTTYQGELKRIQ